MYYPIKSDEEIKSDIETKLFWSPYVEADDVEVTVDRGVAELTGNVGSMNERQAAERNAYKAGAVYVDNELTVVSKAP
jgi:osmotically-inducible protein OsmY